MLRKTAIIKASMEALAQETQQMDAAASADPANDPYFVGIDVSDDEAADAVAASQFSATLSMEASIKELRNGMRVKFSHGHGKIAKIYTAPFFLDKKHHKATKDAPLYLVKHDKGGKHSLHKASALTPAK